MVNKKLNNVERFELAFNRIHSRLKELSKATNSDRFIDLLQENKEKYSVFRYHFHKLKQFAKLRNAIVHERVEDGFYIAEPHLSVVEEIERISEEVLNPPTVYSLASKPVIQVDASATLPDFLDVIAKYGYSQYPVYDQHQFKGLLTNSGIVRWFSENIPFDQKQLEQITIADILKLEKDRQVAFIGKEQNIYDLENLFELYFKNRKKLEAVIITEMGEQHAPPLGIVTSWNLLQIDHSTNSLYDEK
jgi:predicted transcriptional regulator